MNELFQFLKSIPLMPHSHHHRLSTCCLLAGHLLIACMLSGCGDFREKLDTSWLALDPVGHHRYHREKYYPHERRMGIRLPDSMR
jgi:hypothetical protein